MKRRKDVLGSFKSYYDPMADKVHGESQFTTWHEERHQQQRWLILAMSYWILGLVALGAMVALYTGSIILIILFVPPFVAEVALETDAWIYSVRKRREFKKCGGKKRMKRR